MDTNIAIHARDGTDSVLEKLAEHGGEVLLKQSAPAWCIGSSASRVHLTPVPRFGGNDGSLEARLKAKEGLMPQS
jgi:hypothetical protein